MTLTLHLKTPVSTSHVSTSNVNAAILERKAQSVADAQQSIAETKKYVSSISPTDVARQNQAMQAAQLERYADRLSAAERSIAQTQQYASSISPADVAQRNQAMQSAQLSRYADRLAAAERSIAQTQLEYANRPAPVRTPLNIEPAPYYPDSLTRRPRPTTAPANSIKPRVPNATANAGRLAAGRGAAAASRGLGRLAGSRVVGAFGGPVGIAATVGPEIKKATDDAFDRTFPSLAPYRVAAWNATPLGMMQGLANSQWNPLNPFGKLWDWAPWNQKGPANSLNPSPTTSSPGIDPNGFWPVANPPGFPIQFKISVSGQFFNYSNAFNQNVTSQPFPATYEATLTGIPGGFTTQVMPPQSAGQGARTSWIFVYSAIEGGVVVPKAHTLLTAQTAPTPGQYNSTYFSGASPAYQPLSGDSSLSQNQTPVDIEPWASLPIDVDMPPIIEPDARPEYQPEPEPQGYPAPSAPPLISPQGVPYRGPSPIPQSAPAPTPKPNIAQPAAIPQPAPAPQPNGDPSPDDIPRYNPFARPFAPGSATGTGTAPQPTVTTTTITRPQTRPAFEPWPAPQPKPVQEVIRNANPDPDPQPQPQPAPEKPAPEADLCKDPCINDMHNTSKGQKPIQITYKSFVKCSDNGPEFEDKTMDVPADQAEALKTLLNDAADRKGEKCDRTEATMTIPEWWAVRPGADRPQFVLLFAEVYGTGKLGKSRWQLTIPHYNRPQGAKPAIPKYRKGNWQGTLTLTDNSKIRINAVTASEAKRVINKLKILIPVQYRTVNGKAIKPTILERADGDFKECDVVPIRGDYYKTGQRQNLPDWSVNFR